MNEAYIALGLLLVNVGMSLHRVWSLPTDPDLRRCARIFAGVSGLGASLFWLARTGCLAPYWLLVLVPLSWATLAVSRSACVEVIQADETLAAFHAEFQSRRDLMEVVELQIESPAAARHGSLLTFLGHQLLFMFLYPALTWDLLRGKL
jgi:hypothetical protein